MSIETLKFISQEKLVELLNNRQVNRDRYLSSGFSDLLVENGWSAETKDVKVDTGLLEQLDGSSRTAAYDINNSFLLYDALKGMTPAIAAEERIWVRLSHIECIGYTRSRWLAGREGEVLDKQVELHAFASGRTGVRDDNALGRLWWSAHIATLAVPANPKEALQLISKALTMRSAFVERINSASRVPLAQGIVRAMKRDSWLVDVGANCRNFQDFMMTLNRDGGGIAFERMSESAVDIAMDAALLRAKTAAAHSAVTP